MLHCFIPVDLDFALSRSLPARKVEFLQSILLTQIVSVILLSTRIPATFRIVLVLGMQVFIKIKSSKPNLLNSYSTKYLNLFGTG